MLNYFSCKVSVSKRNSSKMFIYNFVLVLCASMVLISGSPIPNPLETPDSEKNGIDLTDRAFPSTTDHKKSNQIFPSVLSSSEQSNSNYTGTLLNSSDSSSSSASEEFTSWHQKRRNSSSGDGDGGGLHLDVNTKKNTDNTTSPNLKQNETESCTLEPAYLCFMDPVHSQRNKEMRLMAIKNYVLSSLGYLNRQPPQINKAALIDRMGGENPSSPFSGQLQSFYASCDLPPSVDQETWASPSFFHIYFNVTTNSGDNPDLQVKASQQNHSSSSVLSHEYAPVTISRPVSSPLRTHSVNIISAKLRLYKIGLGNQAENHKYQELNPSEPCNDTETVDEILPTVFPTTMELPMENLPAVDEKIRVTVYWYTSPATKNHYKRKLLDTKMMSVKESKWVDFDIQKAAKTWLDRKINYGLVVEVENEDNDLVDARKYFSNLPCEIIPTVAESSNPNSTEVGSEPTTPTQMDDILPPPMVEICSLNVPTTSRDSEPSSFFPFPFPMAPSVSTVLSPHPPRSSQSKGNGNSNAGMNVNDFSVQNTQPLSSQSHRHRHNHGGNGKTKSLRNNRHHKRNQSSGQNNQQFKLDEDHPLRQILATVSSNVNSRESRRTSYSNTNLNSRAYADDSSNSNLNGGEGIKSLDYIESDEEGGSDRDIIIQKIYITPPQIHNSNERNNHNNNDRTSSNNNNGNGNDKPTRDTSSDLNR